MEGEIILRGDPGEFEVGIFLRVVELAEELRIGFLKEGGEFCIDFLIFLCKEAV